MPQLSEPTPVDPQRLANVARRQSILERSDEPWAAQAAADSAYLLALLAQRDADARGVLDGVRPDFGATL